MKRLWLAAFVVVAGAVLPPSGAVVAQQTGVAAEIRSGTCDDLGDAVAALAEARIPAGIPQGNAAAVPAARSFTTIPLPLDALAAADHAIVVPFPAGPNLVACGEIGRARTEAGALVVGIAPRGDTAISGIAYLGPSAEPAQTDVSLFVSGDDLDAFLAATFAPTETVAAADEARFAEALEDRAEADRLAGPHAGQLVQRAGSRVARPAGVAPADFVASVAVVNPAEQTGTPWDVGLAFHEVPGQVAPFEIVVSSDGSWFVTDPVNGTTRVSGQDAFDPAPGATNTLDLVVDGAEALFGVNGRLLGRLDLPPAAPSDVYLTTDFAAEKIVDGRAIPFADFGVWALPGTGGATTATGEDDERFAAALAARDRQRPLAGPFRGSIAQSFRGLGGRPAGVSAVAFAATVTFVAPDDPTGAPWDGGLAFHLNPETQSVQEVYVDSNGFWAYTDFPNGVRQSGVVPAFDGRPGGRTTIDLFVLGDSAVLGINGEFVAELALPPGSPSDVLAATDFVVDNVVEGREIAYTDFAVWE